MRALLCVLLLSAFALSAADTDISGTWSGSFAITGPGGETKGDTAWLVLKQNGNQVTGTAGPNQDEQYAIAKGTMDGNKLTLDVDHDGEKIQIILVLADGHLKGDATMSHEGQTMTAKVDVTREKS